MLAIKNVTVRAEEKEIIHNISVDFADGKVYAIMGVNGSGKSSLARTIMGDNRLKVTQGKIFLNKKDITATPTHKRAQMGLFYAPQSPIAISGVTVGQLLRTAIPREKKDSKTLVKLIKKTAKELSISDELLSRSLNENFSGGERKKMEMLQMAILNPRYIILDEIDTGVDVDALKVIARFLKKMIIEKKKTFVLITHYNRILSYLPVDEVIVMRDGTIAQKGDATLAKKIEKEGYENQ